MHQKTSLLTTLRNNNGFTMIEMLIVIILIGFVITFLFNYAGNAFTGASTQQSASKIADDMRIIAEAAGRYEMEKAVPVATLGLLTTTASASGSFFLTSIPNAPTTGITPGSVYTWDPLTNIWGSAAPDTSVKLPGITSIAVCQAINSQYGGLAAGAAVPAAASAAHDMQCYGAASPYTALKSIDIN